MHITGFFLTANRYKLQSMMPKHMKNGKVSNMKTGYTALNFTRKIKKVEGWDRGLHHFFFNLKLRERFPVGPFRSFDLLLTVLKSIVDR